MSSLKVGRVKEVDVLVQPGNVWDTAFAWVSADTAEHVDLDDSGYTDEGIVEALPGQRLIYLHGVEGNRMSKYCWLVKRGSEATRRPYFVDERGNEVLQDDPKVFEERYRGGEGDLQVSLAVGLQYKYVLYRYSTSNTDIRRRIPLFVVHAGQFRRMVVLGARIPLAHPNAWRAARRLGGAATRR